MSYCRFSSDNWKCEVYCYDDVSGGYTTHVAGNRFKGEPPPLPEITAENIDECVRVHRQQMDWLQAIEREPIMAPWAGESFNDPDLPSFLARLESLKALGYRVPAFVFETIHDEMAEEEQQQHEKGQRRGG